MNTNISKNTVSPSPTLQSKLKSINEKKPLTSTNYVNKNSNRENLTHIQKFKNKVKSFFSSIKDAFSRLFNSKPKQQQQTTQHVNQRPNITPASINTQKPISDTHQKTDPETLQKRNNTYKKCVANFTKQLSDISANKDKLTTLIGDLSNTDSTLYKQSLSQGLTSQDISQLNKTLSNLLKFNQELANSDSLDSILSKAKTMATSLHTESLNTVGSMTQDEANKLVSNCTFTSINSLFSKQNNPKEIATITETLDTSLQAFKDTFAISDILL